MTQKITTFVAWLHLYSKHCIFIRRFYILQWNYNTNFMVLYENYRTCIQRNMMTWLDTGSENFNSNCPDKRRELGVYMKFLKHLSFENNHIINFQKNSRSEALALTVYMKISEEYKLRVKQETRWLCTSGNKTSFEILLVAT